MYNARRAGKVGAWWQRLTSLPRSEKCGAGSKQHAPHAWQNQGPIRTATHIDLHISEEILAMHCCSLSKPPCRPRIPLPLHKSVLRRLLPSFFRSSHTGLFSVPHSPLQTPASWLLCSCFLFLVCYSPMFAHPLQLSAQRHLNRKAFPLQPV